MQSFCDIPKWEEFLSSPREHWDICPDFIYDGQSPLSLLVREVSDEYLLDRMPTKMDFDLEYRVNGMPPLSLAAKEQNRAAVEALVERGADLIPTPPYPNGYSVLMKAVARDWPNMVNCLLECGAEINHCAPQLAKLRCPWPLAEGTSLTDIEQVARELQQIELAWISISEAASVKRLSWITFIFLPLISTSSLLGMNVDILEDNPNWTWYLVLAALSLILTVAIWTVYEFLPRMQAWIETQKQRGKGPKRDPENLNPNLSFTLDG
ncbi:hypothetical protein BO71DRAFT_484674 [Aspergillus ellipticus CBS 707.79]|uniref:Uncharacterized protein n=1 Tax=Aspergillus ellipticus CBS 707.79 TaxID=1448320 RepID=A0A319D7T8_9EURO|nr:hypothetical protein BO71DRAFT_484674 [Aspergillus ellipticus CBS 707.79]